MIDTLLSCADEGYEVDCGPDQNATHIEQATQKCPDIRKYDTEIVKCAWEESTATEEEK